MVQLVKESQVGPRIYVVGIGGAGCNAVDSMSQQMVEGITFVVINTDRQALELCKTQNAIQIGAQLTGGHGTGGDPEVGRRCAEEDREQIHTMLQGADLVFLIAGLGGGTGTGATPVVAEIVKQTLGALTVAVVTKPFSFEGGARAHIAEQGQIRLRKVVDTLITVPNDRLSKVVREDTRFVDTFQASNKVLMNCVQSISDLITQPGLINLDFAAIRAVMNETGGTVMGIGMASGPDKANEAFRQASHSALMEEPAIEGATGVLVNITCSEDITFHEVEHAIREYVTNKVHKDARINWGVVFRPEMQDEIKVTILASGVSACQQTASPLYGKDELSLSGVEQPQELEVPAYMRRRRPFRHDEPEREERVPARDIPAGVGRVEREDDGHGGSRSAVPAATYRSLDSHRHFSVRTVRHETPEEPVLRLNIE